MSEWTPPGYVSLLALAHKHGREKLRDELFTGRRRAFVWDHYAGALQPIDPMEWCAREATSWLSGFRYMKGPDGQPISENRVLVREDEQPAESAPEASGTYLSPFMQLMLAAVRHFKITDTTWQKKKDLEDWFLERKLPDGTPVSPAQARYLAMFCRPLAAMSGGNKQDGGQTL